MNWPTVFLTLFNNVRHWAGFFSSFLLYHSSGSSVVIPDLHQHQWSPNLTERHFQEGKIQQHVWNKKKEWEIIPKHSEFLIFFSTGVHTKATFHENNIAHARVRQAGLWSRSPASIKQNIFRPCLFTSIHKHLCKIIANTVHIGTKPENVSLVAEELLSLITSALLALEHIYFFSIQWPLEPVSTEGCQAAHGLSHASLYLFDKR